MGEYEARLARERRARRRAGITGEQDFVPTVRIRAALLTAYAEGVTPAAIERVSGRDSALLHALSEGRQSKCRAHTERDLLAAIEVCRVRKQTGEVSPRRVDAEPTRVLLHRLGAAGWPVSELLRERGIPDNAYRARAKYVTPEVAEQVRRLYDEIDGRMGASLQSARYWRKRGAVVPAADDPDDMLPLPPTTRSLLQRRAM